jgi:hypothetical protein
MRLSEIRKIVLQNFNVLDSLVITQNNNGTSTIDDISIVVDAIENLSNHLPILDTTINQLRSISSIYNARNPSIIVSAGESQAFSRILTEFINQCKVIIDLADTVIPPMKEEMICINLLQTTNLSDVKNLVTDLEEAFSQISNLTNYKGTVRFAGFEAGSDWINLAIEGANYLPFVYILVDAAYRVARDYNNLKLLQQRYQGAFIQNEVNGNLSKVLKGMANKVIQDLQDKKEINIVPDETARVALTLANISKTIIEGNKVLASLTAPSDYQSQLVNSSNMISTQLKDLKLLSSSESIDQIDANDKTVD